MVDFLGGLGTMNYSSEGSPTDPYPHKKSHITLGQWVGYWADRYCVKEGLL